jgi:hypothetical protein
MAQELSASLSPTGKQYSYQITTNLGNFAPTSTFSSQYIGLTATGYYFDEVQNAISAGTITLNSYTDLTSQSVLNVNLLTTLAYQRIQNLVTSGSSVDNAILRAEREVLATFYIRNEESIGSFSAFDLTANNDAANILTALSSTFVYGNTSGQLNAFLAKFQSDLAATGLVTDTSTLNAHAAASKAASSIIDFSAPSIAQWLDQDGDGLIGKYKFLRANATPSTAYTSPTYTIGVDDPNTCDVTTGSLISNGSPAQGSVGVSVGDQLALRLVSGVGYGDSVSGYINCGTTHILKYGVANKLLTLSQTATISNAGQASYLALSPDSKTLYVTSWDTCTSLGNNCNPVSGDGGLYVFSVTNPAQPQKLALAQYLTAPALYAGYQAVVLSLDGSTAYVADSSTDLDVINVAIPSNPSLVSQTSLADNPTGYPVNLALSGSYVFATNLPGTIFDVNVSIPALPVISSTKEGTGYGASPVVVSPDALQLAIGGFGYGNTAVFPLSGTTIGSAIDLSVTYPSAAIAYIGNKTLAILSRDGSSVSIVGLSNPASPVLLGSVRTQMTTQGCSNGGATYLSASGFLYVKKGNWIGVIDVSTPSQPVLRGSLTLTGALLTGGTPPSCVQVTGHDGVSVSSDGSTLYATNFGAVAVVSISQ